MDVVVLFGKDSPYQFFPSSSFTLTILYLMEQITVHWLDNVYLNLIGPWLMIFVYA